MRLSELPTGAKFEFRGEKYTRIAYGVGTETTYYALKEDNTFVYLGDTYDVVWLDAPKVTFGSLKCGERFAVHGEKTEYVKAISYVSSAGSYDGCAYNSKTHEVIWFYNATRVRKL